MSTYILCSLLWLALSGCSPDPLGMTTRTQIRADAYVQKAVQERMAEEAKAQALVDAEIARQAGAKQRTATIMMIVPIIVLIVAAGGCVALVIHWRGKIAYAQARHPAIVATIQQPVLPADIQWALTRRGWRGEWDGQNWWAVVIATGERLPNTFTHLLEVKR